MRNIDKVMLLAEYLSLDASKGVSSFLKWVKETKEYKLFLGRLHKFKNTKSLKGKKLYQYGKEIRFRTNATMEESIITYGKLIHFLNISDYRYYINPLIIDLKDSSKITLGDLQIKFDEKIISLNDVSIQEGYSFDFKKEYIKKALDEWMNEVNEYIVMPITKFMEQKNLVVSRKIFIPSRIIECIYVLLMFSFCLVIRFSQNDVFMLILNNSYGIVCGLLYHLLLSYSLIYILELLITIIFFRVKLKEYRKNYNIISVDINKKAVDAKNKLEQYIYKQLTVNEPLNEKIINLDLLSNYNAPIYYFAKMSATNKKINSGKITLHEKLSFITYTCLAIFFIVLFLIKMGGR